MNYLENAPKKLGIHPTIKRQLVSIIATFQTYILTYKRSHYGLKWLCTRSDPFLDVGCRLVCRSTPHCTPWCHFRSILQCNPVKTVLDCSRPALCMTQRPHNCWRFLKGPLMAQVDPAPPGPKDCKLRKEELVSYQFICAGQKVNPLAGSWSCYHDCLSATDSKLDILAMDKILSLST